MKRLFILLMAGVIASGLLFSASGFCSMFSIGEELSYSGYNNIGVLSKNKSRYSADSITMNTKVSNEIGYKFSDAFAICGSMSLGYQRDLYSYNRFVSIPDNINGSVSAGFKVFPLKSLGISVMGGLRTTYMTNKSKWISQLGGVASLECYFGSFSIGLSGGYWHNTNYRSMVGSINVGLVF